MRCSEHLDEYASARVQHLALNAYQVAKLQGMQEALASDLSKEWRQAADAEYKSLIENETWDLVELPNGKNLLKISGY